MSNPAFQFSPDAYDAGVPIPTTVQPTSTHLPVQLLSPLLFSGPASIGPGPMPNSEFDMNQDPGRQRRQPTSHFPEESLPSPRPPERTPIGPGPMKNTGTNPPSAGRSWWTGRSCLFWTVLGVVILIDILATVTVGLFVAVAASPLVGITSAIGVGVFITVAISVGVSISTRRHRSRSSGGGTGSSSGS